MVTKCGQVWMCGNIKPVDPKQKDSPKAGGNQKQQPKKKLNDKSGK